MNTQEQAELLASVPAPTSLSESEVKIARDYVLARFTQDSFQITQFIEDSGLNTKKWYYGLMKNTTFVEYTEALTDALIPDNEIDAVRAMKKKIQSYAYKQSASPQEVKLFAETFNYVFEAEERTQRKKLGLPPKHGLEPVKEIDTRTVAEKREYLFKRLRER